MATQTAQGDPFSLDQVLAGISDLETSDLEFIQHQVNLVLAGRRVPSLRKEEALLFQKINNRLTPEIWRRYHIFPLNKGGSNDLENLVNTCGGCKMGHTLDIEWLQFEPIVNLLTVILSRASAR